MAREKHNSGMLRNSAGFFVGDQLPDVDDQFQKLRDAVVLKQEKDPGLRAILVTAESHGDGATTVAVNLAQTLARGGRSRVLLVDGDLRRPVLHTLFDLDNELGFTNILAGEAKGDGVVQETSASPISVVTVGTVDTHPSQLNMDKLNEALVWFKNSFDYIIFNSSPINRYSDSIVLASQLDATILVMRAEHTKWDGLERAKRQLNSRGVPILGAVMNRRKYYIPRILYARFFI